jgi:hypothetical protein
MNDDELRDALRPADGIEPLDPAKVIAGANRRRRRNLTAGGAAAAAVLAVVAGGVIAVNGTSGSPAIDPVSTPSNPSPSTARTPQASSAIEAQVLAGCRSAVAEADPHPGAKVTRQAVLSTADGTAIIIADGKYWAACDTGYQDGAREVSVRQPAEIVRPDAGDADAFAVANNVVTKAGKEYDYFWAGGLLPAGVKTVRYTFPDAASEDAVATDKYWLMRHWSPRADGQRTPGAPAKIRVRLLGANGAVLGDLRLEWGKQTCAQITHGC